MSSTMFFVLAGVSVVLGVIIIVKSDRVKEPTQWEVLKETFGMILIAGALTFVLIGLEIKGIMPPLLPARDASYSIGAEPVDLGRGVWLFPEAVIEMRDNARVRVWFPLNLVEWQKSHHNLTPVGSVKIECRPQYAVFMQKQENTMVEKE